MGPGSFVALRLGAQLCCRAVFPRAWPAASATPRLRLLAVGRPMARAALGRACLALDRARGLHGGPGLEEQAEGTADEGLPESGTADHAGPKFDIDMLVSLLRQENARDICVIRVPPEMKYTDYFVIGSGTSTRHLHAMAYYIVKMYKHLKHESEPHVKIEGKDTDDWLCVDFGDSISKIELCQRFAHRLCRITVLSDCLPSGITCGARSKAQHHFSLFARWRPQFTFLAAWWSI
ncbi:mitochondrial assembly of ribosomal large subunit protein 1 isoform X1 [Ovis canadensis]|uniref:mitochondrial assembly of ribosomal large subunit protein 1 isoform X1 n=1 Tax=Ovis canadensis TaxID=37174 RepID=UPI0037525260